MVEMCTHLATERAGVVTLHLRESAAQLSPHPFSHTGVVYPVNKRAKIAKEKNYPLL